MIPYESRLEQAVDYLVLWFRIKAPKESGNLALNGIKKVWNPTIWSWDIVIGGELAPYAVYTNGIWVNRPGINPNEGWIQDACMEARPVLVAILSGTITTDDYNKMLNKNKMRLDTQFIQMAESI